MDGTLAMYAYLKKYSAPGNKRAIANNVDMNIEVSKSDLDRIHADSIGVPGTDTYVGGLGVYHELHCLVRNPIKLFHAILTQQHHRNVFVNIRGRIIIMQMPPTRTNDSIDCILVSFLPLVSYHPLTTTRSLYRCT